MTVPLSQLPVGTHTVRAVVLDTTALTRSTTHLTLHTYTVTWTVNRTATSVSLAAGTAEYEVETYPNPVADALSVAYTLPRPAPVAFTVLDAAGRTVKTIRYPRQAPGRYQYQLRPEELGLHTPGRYTLLLDVDGVVMSRPLLKE